MTSYSISKSEYPQGRFLFVVATRRSEDELQSMPIYKTLFTRINIPKNILVDCKIAFRNEDGLSKVYNSVLNDDSIKLYDYVAFIHDDIWINDVLIFDKLKEASNDYDLIGVCGGKSWDVPDDETKPHIWTIAAKNAGMSGFMIHAGDKSLLKNSKSTTYRGKVMFVTAYGDCPSPVLTIDGSFICMTRNAIESGLRFDERFTFHFYDMDVSFSAFVKKLRTGTSAVCVTHESLGTSVAQPSYMDGQKMFIEKWFSSSES